ncbi:MAG: hypothetical protein GX564_10090 [Oligosphaeraceae bacterium]|nr:hypothetical protein [Oligosphaeraceae bacterium]
MKYLLLCAALLLSAATMSANEENLLQNPGFENAGKNGLPLSWGISNPKGGGCALDDQVVHSGKYSLRFSSIDSYIACQQSFGEMSTLDHDFRLSGWVKYDNIRNDTVDFKTYHLPFFGIWTSKKGRNSFNFNALSLPPGSSDWQFFEKIYRREDIQGMIAKRNFADRPTHWSIRINISQQPGSVWFDDLSFVRLPAVVNLRAQLNSREYIVNSRNAILSLNLVNATAEQETVVRVGITALDSQTVLLQQEHPVRGGVSAVSLPTRALPVGSYRLTCTPADANIQPAQLLFNIAADPFAE